MADPDLNRPTPRVQPFNEYQFQYEERPKSPDTEEVTKLSDFCSNKPELAKGLGYNNVTDLDMLLNSKLIKPQADELRDWLWNQILKNGKGAIKGADFKRIFNAIKIGEASMSKYSCPGSDMARWVEVDRICYFVFWTAYKNLQNREGCLNKKGFSDMKNYFYMFQIYKYYRQQWTPSKLAKLYQKMSAHTATVQPQLSIAGQAPPVSALGTSNLPASNVTASPVRRRRPAATVQPTRLPPVPRRILEAVNDGDTAMLDDSDGSSDGDVYKPPPRDDNWELDKADWDMMSPREQADALRRRSLARRDERTPLIAANLYGGIYDPNRKLPSDWKATSPPRRRSQSTRRARPSESVAGPRLSPQNSGRIVPGAATIAAVTSGIIPAPFVAATASGGGNSTFSQDSASSEPSRGALVDYSDSDDDQEAVMISPEAPRSLVPPPSASFPGTRQSPSVKRDPSVVPQTPSKRLRGSGDGQDDPMLIDSDSEDASTNPLLDKVETAILQNIEASSALAPRPAATANDETVDTKDEPSDELDLSKIDIYEPTSWQDSVEQWQNAPRHEQNLNKYRVVQRRMVDFVTGHATAPWMSDRPTEAVADAAHAGNPEAETINWSDAALQLMGNNRIHVKPLTQSDFDDYDRNELFLLTTPNINYDKQEVFDRRRMLGTVDTPRAKGMSSNCSLNDLQLKGYDDILNIRTKYKGGMLADFTGLGKTIQYVASSVQATEDRLREIEEGSAADFPGPVLCVMPSSILDQQAEEIGDFLDQLTDDSWQVLKYQGDGRALQSNQVPNLTQQSEIFTPNTVNARTFILTSVQTLDRRHGPQAMKKYLSTLRDYRAVDPDKYKYTPIPEAPCYIPGKFFTVVADEAHLLKAYSSETDQLGNWGMSVGWLCPEFTLLVTATPSKNSVHDWEAYLTFMQPRILPRKPNGTLYTATDADKFDPYIESSKLPAACKLNPHFARHHVFRDGLSDDIQGVNLRSLQKEIMVRRGYKTLVNGKPMEQILPRLHKRRIECTWDSDEAKQRYLRFEKGPKSYLAQPNKETGRIIWNGGAYRHLCLLTSWLGFEANLALIGSHKLKEMKADGKHQLHKWLMNYKALIEEQERERGTVFNVPDRTDYVGQVKLIISEAPKIKNLLALISDEVIVNNENTIVWTQFPAQQILLHAIFSVFNLKVDMVTSDLTEPERRKIIADFCKENRKGKVLILSYHISAAGLNLQSTCHLAEHFDTPYNQATREQADGRIRRLGQTHDCYSWAFGIKGTFNDTQLANFISKAMANNYSEMNPEIFDVEVSADQYGKKECKVGNMVLVDGKMCQGDSPSALKWVRAGGSLQSLDAEGVVDWIQNWTLGDIVSEI